MFLCRKWTCATRRQDRYACSRSGRCCTFDKQSSDGNMRILCQQHSLERQCAIRPSTLRRTGSNASLQHVRPKKQHLFVGLRPV